jgi:hypothetical protein
MAGKQNSDGDVTNLLVDCSHNYSFNLSNASRTQDEIFPGINVLTSGRTIHKLNLAPINALVVLMDGKLPYEPADAPYLLEYIENGGGLYVAASTSGLYADSCRAFLEVLGLRDAGPRLSKNLKNWGISAHAPSELVFPIDGKYERFTSRVGPWADYSRGSVSFEVYGDGECLHKGQVLSKGVRESIDVSVKGVKKLRLVATDGGDGKAADGSIWFDPRLVTADDDSERVLLKDATSVKVGWAEATQDQHFNGNPLGIERAADMDKGAQSVVAASHAAAVPGATFSPAGKLPNIVPVDTDKWETVYQLDGEPVVLARQYGQGTVIVDLTGQYYASNGQKEPSVAVMRKMIEAMSADKKVDALKGGGGWQFSEGYRWDLIATTDDGLRVHHNEYSKMYVPNDVHAYQEAVKYLTELTGLTEKHKAAQIKELNDRKAKYQMGTQVDVDISGIQELTLITTNGGNDIHSDHAIWADASFVDAAGNRTKLRLADASSAEVGYGAPTEDALPGGEPFSIGGRVFKTGVFLHANAKMVIPTDGEYVRFTSWVGCNDKGYGSVGFKVIGDGKVLWNDGKVYYAGTPGGNPKDVNYIPEGILFQLKYLACVGAGFLLPQGSAVDLPPALKDDWQVHLGMLSHEMGHAWSFPFCEKIGEEASAFIFNNLVLHRHYGQKHGDSVTRRLMNYLKNDDLDDIDLAKSANNFKYYMFIDLMIREYGENVWKNYNLLKYALLNKEGAVWDAHSTAWLWSVATGEDLFGDFQRAFGTSVAKDNVKLPEKAMAAGFDPIAVGELYDIPMLRLEQKRDIFSKLKSFTDVRAFYAKEHAEKGGPAKEG